MFGLFKKKVVEEPKEIVYVLTIHSKNSNKHYQWSSKNKAYLVNRFVKWFHSRPQSQTFFMEDALGGTGLMRSDIFGYKIRKEMR